MRAWMAGGIFGVMAVLAVSGPVEAGEMYQWVDADGKKHFTDRPPPPGIGAEKAALPAAPAPGRQAQAASDGAAAEPASDFARQLREKQQKMAQERMQAQKEQGLSAEEERKKRAAQKQAQQKADKCKRLKDVADKAYAFKGRYERECE